MRKKPLKNGAFPLHLLIGCIGGALCVALSLFGPMAIAAIPLCTTPYALMAFSFPWRKAWTSLTISALSYMTLAALHMPILSAFLNYIFYCALFAAPFFFAKHLLHRRKCTTHTLLVLTTILFTFGVTLSALTAYSYPTLRPLLEKILTHQTIDYEHLAYILPLSITGGWILLILIGLWFAHSFARLLSLSFSLGFSLPHLKIPNNALWLPLISLPLLALKTSTFLKIMLTTCALCTALPAFFNGLQTINLFLLQKPEKKLSPFIYITIGILFLIPSGLFCIVLIGLIEPLLGLRQKLLLLKNWAKKK